MEKIHIDFVEDDFRGDAGDCRNCAIARVISRIYKLPRSRLVLGKGLYDYKIGGINYTPGIPVINGKEQDRAFYTQHFVDIQKLIEAGEFKSASLDLIPQ